MIFDEYNIDKLYAVEIKNFFRGLDISEIQTIEKSKILELKEKAKLVKFKRSNPRATDFFGIGKFANTLRHIRMNPKVYKLESTIEQFLLFMFCIDPNFEALKILAESNRTDEVKKKCKSTFGIFSPELLKLEKASFESLIDQDEKEKIEEEMDKRVYS